MARERERQDCAAPAQHMLETREREGEDCTAPAQHILETQEREGEDCTAPAQHILETREREGQDCAAPVQHVLDANRLLGARWLRQVRAVAVEHRHRAVLEEDRPMHETKRKHTTRVIHASRS